VYAAIPAYSSALPEFKAVPLGRQEPVAVAKPEKSSDRPPTIADELLFLGLYDEAATEVERGRSSMTADPAKAVLMERLRS
jgi:hypothetical protein